MIEIDDQCDEVIIPEEQENHSDHNEEEPDQGPHLVISAPEPKKKERVPRRTGRKRTRQAPYELKTELNTEPSSEPQLSQFKKIKSVRKRLLPPEDDQKSQELRNELKFLILNNAKLNGLNSETELKKELNRAARLKASDLQFELDKMRLITDRAWTRDLARCIRDGTGIALDVVTRCNGHVAKEFQDDTQLESVLHDHLKKVAAFMNPKIRIGLLASKDFAFGYLKNRSSRNVVEEIPPPPPLVRQNAYMVLPEVNT